MAIAGMGGGGSASRVNVELFFLLLSEDATTEAAAPQGPSLVPVVDPRAMRATVGLGLVRQSGVEIRKR